MAPPLAPSPPTTASSASSSPAATATALDSVSKSFYYRATASFAVLLSPAFLNAYVRTGSLHALTLGTAIDHAPLNASIGPDGVLRLAVDTDTYERLGLVGTASNLEKSKRPQRWNIA